jgi:hypothetical protein
VHRDIFSFLLSWTAFADGSATAKAFFDDLRNFTMDEQLQRKHSDALKRS